ncbi:MAG: hypothetical protein KBT27_15135 [Prevotellaceae bacterium]|nr:hypothetical protein [Candidatus Faecinaster equi]
MDNIFHLCPMDILQHPDIQESLDMLRLCGIITESIDQHLTILNLYVELRQRLPPETKKKEIYERINSEKSICMDSESIRKLIERFQSPISNKDFNAFVLKHHFVP